MKITLEMLAGNMPGGLLVYKADGEEEILFASREVARLFECDTVEEFLYFIGGTFKNVVYASDIYEVERTIWEQLETSGGYNYVKYRIITKNGTFKSVEDWGHLVHDKEHGDLFYVYLHDESLRDRLVDISIERETRKRRIVFEETDSLTGLPNETYFRAKAPELIREYLLEGIKPAIAYFDIRDFRSYNENYGHIGGDRLLKTVAEKLEASFDGERSLAARLTGDHFVALSAEGDMEYAVKDLNNSIRNVRRGTETEVKCGVYRVEDRREDLDDAINFAKSACDKIRLEFGTQLSVYDHDADQRIKLKKFVTDNFDAAMRDKHITVHYQPIVDVKTGEVVLLEALARWKDPAYGFIDPGAFLSVLEERHQIYKLDSYVVEQACREIKKRMDAGEKVAPVSVNLSALDFELVDMLKVIDVQIRMFQIPKAYLHLEISENEMMRDMERLKTEIRRFRDNGFQIWMDDFGSAALSIIQDVDLDGFKIDMRLVQSYEENGKAGHVLAALIALSKGLGVKALAKGVEEDTQMAFLKEAGCDLAQGYLIGRPAPEYRAGRGRV